MEISALICKLHFFQEFLPRLTVTNCYILVIVSQFHMTSLVRNAHLDECGWCEFEAKMAGQWFEAECIWFRPSSAWIRLCMGFYSSVVDFCVHVMPLFYPDPNPLLCFKRVQWPWEMNHWTVLSVFCHMLTLIPLIPFFKGKKVVSYLHACSYWLHRCYHIGGVWGVCLCVCRQMGTTWIQSKLLFTGNWLVD